MTAVDTVGFFPDARSTARLAIVIPAYNEAATIAAILCRCRQISGSPAIFVVDDGSHDETAAIAAQHGAIVLRHLVNLGKGAALMRGMRAGVDAGADHVVTLDGDGQHRPDDVPRLLAAAARWPDRIVIGSRRNAQTNAPRARVVANRVADFWISWAARHPIDDSQCGFRLYPVEALRRLLSHSHSVMSAKAGIQANHPESSARAMDSRVRRNDERERSALARGFAFESEVLIEAARAGYRTVSVAIPAIYGEALQRPSHFRPVSDITWIVLMVAGKLLRRGMDPVGLWQSVRETPTRWYDPSRDGTGDHGSMIVARPDTSTCPFSDRRVKP